MAEAAAQKVLSSMDAQFLRLAACSSLTVELKSKAAGAPKGCVTGIVGDAEIHINMAVCLC